MRSEYRLIENDCDDDRKRVLHIIKIEDNPRGGWYTQIGAGEGMLRRSLTRWYDYWFKGKGGDKRPNAYIRFDRYDPSGEKMRLKVSEEFKTEYIPPREIHHDSVWAFFDSIGYDHKDKRVSNTDKFLIIGIHL